MHLAVDDLLGSRIAVATSNNVPFQGQVETLECLFLFHSVVSKYLEVNIVHFSLHKDRVTWARSEPHRVPNGVMNGIHEEHEDADGDTLMQPSSSSSSSSSSVNSHLRSSSRPGASQRVGTIARVSAFGDT